jgi:hypothetical protein
MTSAFTPIPGANAVPGQMTQASYASREDAVRDVRMPDDGSGEVATGSDAEPELPAAPCV